MERKLSKLFTKKEFHKTSQIYIRIENVIRRKGNKLKRKDYDNSFNSCIDKKRYSYMEGVLFHNHFLIKTK